MSDVIVRHSRLMGEIDISKVAPSKSILHREMICSSLCNCDMPLPVSEDTKATYDIMRHILYDNEVCFCNESASTLRFLIPLSIYLGGRTFETRGNLINRPLGVYDCIKGGTININGNFITTGGTIRSGDFYVDGSISSQFISGLMFVLPMLCGDSNIILINDAQSLPYIEMTVAVLSLYGIEINKTDKGWFIKGKQTYKKADIHTIEGDFSYGANYVVLSALGQDIKIKGLDENSMQGDRAIYELLDKDEIDVSMTPDLFPILCVYACGKETETRIYGAKRLRYKECDRLSAMARELEKTGGDITEKDDEIIIRGKGKLRGGEVYSHNDHRIAMALTVAGLVLCENDLIIKDSECVKKSVPLFYEHIRRLGGKV